jgi:vacuolar-type H+-ATPase subunit H
LTIGFIKDIRQAEEQADQLARQSAADARGIVAGAQAEAERIRRESEAAARGRAGELLALAEQKAGEDIAALDGRIADECAGIAGAARARFAEAAEIIAGRIVRFNVDS